MPASKAQQKAVNKYMKANYDRITVTMPKGGKEAIQAVAAAAGQSVNAYINQAIASRMESGGVQSATASDDVPGGGGVLTPAALETALEAAQKTGETVSAFLERAVSVQAQRDGVSFRMGTNPATGEKMSRDKKAEAPDNSEASAP